jgi:hypothetical protein
MSQVTDYHYYDYGDDGYGNYETEADQVYGYNEEVEPTHFDEYRDYEAETDDIYGYDEEAELAHLNNNTFTWLLPPPPMPTPFETVPEHELEAYAEAASNRILNWDDIHPAYRDHPTDDKYENTANVPDPSSGGHWIQARPIQLLTTHIAEPVYTPTDDEEYEEISDEYLEQVQLHQENLKCTIIHHGS